jgi:hypothetical protein
MKACPYCGAFGGNNKEHMSACMTRSKKGTYPDISSMLYTTKETGLNEEQVRLIVRGELMNLIPKLLDAWWEKKL